MMPCILLRLNREKRFLVKVDFNVHLMIYKELLDVNKNKPNLIINSCLKTLFSIHVEVYV